MAHFAKVKDGIVVRVIVADQQFIDSYMDNEPGVWIQTSYNTFGGVHYEPGGYFTPSQDQSKALRKNFAGVGFFYDRDLDAFIPPKEFPSWILNKETCLWEPPVPMPDDGKFYRWDELTKSWIEQQ